MTFVKAKKNSNCSEYIPKNPEKYKGRYPIIIRSSWERMFCQWIDVNMNVISWASETHTVPYYDPVQMKYRRYYPDFWMKVKTKDGFEEYLIEVKPKKETEPPKSVGNKSKKTKLHQEATWLTNKAKFEAAEKYCKKMGYIFKLITEKELFNK
jgi:hypothetical protein